jgi:hypothetical protein
MDTGAGDSHHGVHQPGKLEKPLLLADLQSLP